MIRYSNKSLNTDISDISSESVASALSFWAQKVKEAETNEVNLKSSKRVISDIPSENIATVLSFWKKKDKEVKKSFVPVFHI